VGKLTHFETEFTETITETHSDIVFLILLFTQTIRF